MAKLAWIFLGGGAGAGFRYLLSNAEWLKLENGFPMGTLLVNLLGCFLIGLLWQSAQNNELLSPLLIIGFCGGYSTFSTFSNETFMLIDNGQSFLAILNILISVLVGVGLIFLIRSRA